MSASRLATESPAGSRSQGWRVVTAGALVGILDGAFALLLCVTRSSSCVPARVFQSIASGLLGRRAFDGGLATAALGVVIHFGIAFIWAGAYWILYRRWGALRALTESVPGTAAASVAYGMLVWLIMDLVMLPLSGARPTPVSSPVFTIILLGHPVVVGLPIVALIRVRGTRRDND